jgi:hypothetical protein
MGFSLIGGSRGEALPEVLSCLAKKCKVDKGKTKVGEPSKRHQLGNREGQLSSLLSGTLASFPRMSFNSLGGPLQRVRGCEERVSF